MTLQQFGGANGIGFYASETFDEAGIRLMNLSEILFCLCILYKMLEPKRH